MPIYTYKGHEPQPLPERIRLSNGLTRTDSSTFTEEEIANAGYTLAEDRPMITVFQNLSWNQTGWVVENKSDTEMTALRNNEWHAVRQKRKLRLEETDWVIIRQLERGEKVDEDILIYRQALRDITLQSDPFNLEWPDPPPGIVTNAWQTSAYAQEYN